MGLLVHQTSNHKPYPYGPYLFFLEELFRDTSHALINPINKTISSVECPELNFQVQCLASRQGWLLLLSRETKSLFFFNPFTRARFDLPYRKQLFDAAAFTAPPTSSDCIIYAVEKPYNQVIHIDVLRFGNSSWCNFTFGIKDFATFKQAFYYNGHLYCIDSLGRFGDFDAREGTWSVLRPMKRSILRNSFLMESDSGEIFAVMTSSYGVLGGLYKLRFQGEKVNLDMVKDLGGATVFVGPYGSCSPSTSIEGMENKVILAGNRSDRMFTIYNFQGGDCREETAVNDNEFGPRYAPVWIEKLN